MDRAARDAAVRTETAISTAVYALIPTAVLWLAGAPPPASLFGVPGMIPALVLPAGVGTFMMTLGLTLILRARGRRGALPALGGPRGGVLRVVPVALVPRALVLALAAVALFVPAGLAVVALLHVLPLSTGGFVVFNLVYGACLGVVMTPPVVLAAMADLPPAGT